MSIRWTYRCDGPRCDVTEEVEGGASSSKIFDRRIEVGNVTVWRGHLCDECLKGAAAKIKAAMTSGEPRDPGATP